MQSRLSDSFPKLRLIDPPVQLPHQAGPSSPREAMPQRRPSGWTGSWGGFQVDNDSVRWGDRFVADSNGLRIGNIVMDSRGIRMNGQPIKSIIGYRAGGR